MNRLRGWLLISCLFGALRVCAATIEEEVRTTDAARIRATIAGEAERLAPLLSDRLSYGHADGRVQTKADFLDAVRSHHMRYESYDYEFLQIDRVTDEVAALSGRASLIVRIGEQHVAFRLRFLAVWHREADGWKLFAYQSAQLPASVAP